jgi:hypothetical protein
MKQKHFRDALCSEVRATGGGERIVVSCQSVISEFVALVKFAYELGYTSPCEVKLLEENTCVSTFEFLTVHMNTASTGK